MLPVGLGAPPGGFLGSPGGLKLVWIQMGAGNCIPYWGVKGLPGLVPSAQETTGCPLLTHPLATSPTQQSCVLLDGQSSMGSRDPWLE